MNNVPFFTVPLQIQVNFRPMVTGHQELVRKWIFGLDLYQDPTNVLVDTQIHALKRKSGVIAIQVKFIYSEKATKFCEIFLLLLTYVLQSKVRGRFRKILWPSQNI